MVEPSVLAPAGKVLAEFGPDGIVRGTVLAGALSGVVDEEEGLRTGVAGVGVGTGVDGMGGVARNMVLSWWPLVGGATATAGAAVDVAVS